MANPNESKWYYISGTIYYVIAIVVALAAGIFKYCPAQTRTVSDPTVTAPTVIQDTCPQSMGESSTISSDAILESPSHRSKTISRWLNHATKFIERLFAET